MSAPICVKHQTPMKAGDPEKGGGWYCSKRDPSTKTGWCDQRINAPAITSPSNAAFSTNPLTSPSTAAGNKAALTAAALICAGQLYHQSGQPGEAFVMDFVDKVLSQFGGTE
jgi:ABC-type uncharacterized transport system involved in gliding motility auxiliary subunit